MRLPSPTALLACVLAAPPLGACAGAAEDDDTTAPDDDTPSDDDGTPWPEWPGAEVTLDPFSVRFGAGELPPGGLVLGVETTYDPLLNHDPWNGYAEEFQEFVPHLAWAVAERASWQGEDLLLDLSDGHRATLSRREGGEGLALKLTFEDGAGEAGAAVASYVRLDLRAADGEGLYGLGETFGSVDQRGQVLTMQHEIDATLEGGYNETHVPVPFLVGSSGWGVGLESDWPAVWDVAATVPGVVRSVSHAPEGLDLRLFQADDAAEIPAMWARSTALPRRPPDWALAPMLWRNENVDGDEVLADAEAVRANDLAFGVMWIDNPWQTYYNSMQPDPAMFPDWEGMVARLNDLGFRWMAWTTPYVDDDDPERALYESEGWFADIPYTFGEFGPLVDLTNPDAAAAWTARVEAAEGIGLEGWKLDYGEDVNVGLGGVRLVSSFWNGQDERTMHHRFAQAFHEAYARAYDDGDRFLLGRAGAYGTASVTDCIWPGDLDSDFRRFREDGHVGGLPSAIRGGISLSVSGFPCFASDTGGFRHERPTHEVMGRWTEYAALHPVMQVGGGGDNHHYWDFQGGWNEETLAIGRRYTVLHTRLFPFFRTLLEDAATSGTPPILPLGLVGGPHVDDAFVLGRTVLVAPVEEAGATSRTVSFPPGRWIHWWTGVAWEGEAVVPAPLGEGPLFLAEGGIVPLLRESVRTIAPSAEGVDSFSDDPGVLTLRVVPGDGALAVLDGPAVDATSESITLGDPGVFTGLAVEIWAPGAARVRLGGAEIPSESDGTWIRAAVTPGTVTWE